MRRRIAPSTGRLQDFALTSATRFQHVPNIISSLRLISVPVLVFLAMRGDGTPFTWLLVAALVSDIADGLIARKYKLTSKVGALLDSIADALLMLVAGYGIWVFHPQVVLEYRLAFALVLTFWLLENVAALLRYGRLSSFHTYLSKAAGYAVGIFIGSLFVFGFHSWLLYLAAGLSTAGNLEELWLLSMLPTWKADVKGVWWVRSRVQ